LSLRVLFCGTPEFARPSLDAVVAGPHQVTGVVTVPDRPKGRGQKLQPSPVKIRATELGLDVLQPEQLDDPEFLAAVDQAAPDLLLVVAFRILPEVLFSRPRLGAINLHASLLPAYRGAAPIARAVMDGCTETGVTTFQIVRRVDRGGLLLRKRVAIEPDDNAGTLALRLAQTGSSLVAATLDGLDRGDLVPTPQDNRGASLAPKLAPEDRPIRWEEPAATSHNRVRALAPYPGATVRRNDKLLKILEAGMDAEATTGRVGEVMGTDDARGIAVATGQGTLYLRHLQPEGKKSMDAPAYVRGYPISPGDRFE
jgi:methionyl-tRNA formyltransferase